MKLTEKQLNKASEQNIIRLAKFLEVYDIDCSKEFLIYEIIYWNDKNIANKWKSK
jgi:hypothetical protein